MHKVCVWGGVSRTSNLILKPSLPSTYLKKRTRFTCGACPIPSGVDMVSVDWTVSLDDAKKRLDAVRPGIGVQGNLDPAVLLSNNPALIKERAEEILAMGGGRGHVMNLGHGIEVAHRNLERAPRAKVYDFF